jgi:MscS family membrane protein
MDVFWDSIFLDNTMRQWAIVIAVILLAYILKKFIGRYISSWAFMLMKSMGRFIDKASFVDLIIGPVENFLFVLISFLAIKTLTFPEILNVKIFRIFTVDILEAIGEFIIIYFFIRMLLRLVDYMALVMGKEADLTPSQDDNQLIVFFKDFVKVILLMIGALVMLQVIFHQDLTKVLAGLSIVGAAIALAARESIENLIASFIIFFDKPFTVGDLLKVNNVTGVVEHIGLRSTRIRTVEKTFVTVPNKQMVDSVVDNYTLRTYRRGEIKVTVDASTTSVQLENLIAGIKGMLETNGLADFNVQFAEIVNDGFTVHFDYLTNLMDWKEFLLQKDKINLSMMRLLEDLSIELAGKHSVINVVKG